MKIVHAAPDSSFFTTIPPGEYFVGDPCYIWGRDGEGQGLYDKLLAIKSERDNWNETLLLDVDSKFALVYNTAHGDGSYPLVSRFVTQPTDDGDLGVDSGQLAIIDKSLVDASYNLDLMAVIKLDGPQAISLVDGNLDGNGISIVTGREEEEDCWPDEDEDEEDEDILGDDLGEVRDDD